MGLIKKGVKKIVSLLGRRWPGILFLFEYSPKEQERRDFIRKIMNYAADSKLLGDYLEFGVFRGGSFVNCYQQATRHPSLKDMRFFAFDSFGGLPKIQGVDAEFRHFEEGEYKAERDLFEKNLKNANVDFQKIKIVPGWFNETLNVATKKQISLSSAAVVWIDCDLYESTVPVLDFISENLTDGSVIVFDDWFTYRGSPARGEQGAFNEWLKKHPEFSATQFHTYDWHGNSFIIHKAK